MPGFVLLSLLVVGCHVGRPWSPPPLDCHRIPVSLDPKARLGALISVHAHAFGLAAHHPVMSLTDATSLVECDDRAQAIGSRSRKRRVVAELAAFGRLKDFARPLARLGVDLSRIRAEVEARYPYTYPFLLRDPPLLEMIISNMIAEDPSLGGMSPPPPGGPDERAAACDDWTQDAPFAVWHKGPVITVDGKVSVGVPLVSVESNMDPQRWDECSPLWDPPCDATYIQEPALGGGYKKKVNPPKPGSDYARWETLFEHFICKAAGCAGWFDNRLQVKNEHTYVPSQPSLRGYVINYSLPKYAAIDGCVGSTDAKCPGPAVTVKVETDQGWLEVYPEKGRTSVVTHKEVRLDNAIANGITQALLTYAELARNLAEHACCLKAREPRAPRCP